MKIKVTIAALLLLAAAALAGVGRPEAAGGAGEDTREGITVTGTGEVRDNPDRAGLSFSVHADGTTAAEALSAGNAKMRRVIAALKEAGVGPNQLKTDYLGVSPRYDGEGKAGTNGYSADASLTVGDQSVEQAGRLVDIGVSAGADSVSGPSLSIAAREARYRAALKLAVRNARAKAQELAEAAGVSVGKATSIVEGAQYGGPIMATLERAADAQTPIEPGVEEVTAAVTVTFALS
jgi:uncharacterized protein